ncbi:MAG: CheR family methyltransferase, partial [Alphaproteobacteria bacterium]
SLYLAKYFEKDGDSWRLKPAVRDMVTFQPFNLLDDPRSLGRFDVVFCRNVLIYFDFPTKGAVLDRIGQAMAADGMLYLGGVETVYGVTDRFGPLGDQRGVYGLVNTSAKAASAA